MTDLFKPSYPRVYAASGLFNLAWAQVQNKPLNEVLMEFEMANDSAQEGGVDEDDTENWIAAASDDEKEEGELEEGDIDLESEPMEPENCSLGDGFGEIEIDGEDDRVYLIRKMLDNVNAKETEKSFSVACARLRSSVESARDLGWFPTKDALIQQFLGAFECVKSVFSAMSPLQKEQNKGAMSRLITYTIDLHPALFSPDQMKAIEAAMMMVGSPLDSSKRKKTTVNGQEDLPVRHHPRLLTHPYESDVFRAFSLYQQKFGHISSSSFSKLPSPTPSEENNCGEVDDAGGEVSSFPHQTTASSTKPSIPPQPVVSRSPNENSSIVQGLNTKRTAIISGSVPHCASHGTAKSRYPRLRHMKPNLATVEVPPKKKQKHDIEHNNCSKHEESRRPAVPAQLWSDVDHILKGYDDKQKAEYQKERARRIAEQRKLFSSKKLSLVLDLDHTLLNSAKFSEVDPIHDELLRKKEERDRNNKQYRQLFRFPHMEMWTKLRPGIWTFLEKASKHFELHVYTMGNKKYATEMAKLLDPNGTLFGGRVISSKRGDDGDDLLDVENRQKTKETKDLEGVLGMESGVLIMDDTIKVWPHNQQNLIVVERYLYFPCSRRQFGLSGSSLLDIDHDERADEGTLASSLAVIEKIHQNFFAHERLEDVDVRNILASEQKKILAGCRILFSGIFRVGEVNPHLHPLWNTAEQFGAVCTNQIDEQVTHVVTKVLGTEKVNWALSTGRYVVNSGWVEASALLYRRANELDFALKPSI